MVEHASAESDARSSGAVIVVGVFPPPVHGMARVTQLFSERIGEAAPVVRIDVSPGAVAGRSRALGRARKLARTLAAWPRLAALRAKGARALYLPLDNHLGLYLDVATLAIARGLGLPAIVHHHSAEYLARRRPILTAIDRLLGPRGLHVFTCARFRERFRALYGERARSLALSNALVVARDPDLAARSPPASDREAAVGAIRLGHLSNLSKEKGLDVTLRTAEALLAGGLDISLSLAGPCDLACDREMIAEFTRRSGGRIAWRGPVHGAAKAAFLDALDLFLFPTRYSLEAEPLVVLEALSSGVPVVAFGRGCIDEMVRPGAGTVVPVDGDFIAACATLTRRLSADPEALAAAKAAARASFASRAAAAERQHLAFLAAAGLAPESFHGKRGDPTAR